MRKTKSLAAVAALVMIAALGLMSASSPALAAPAWNITSYAYPTHFRPNISGQSGGGAVEAFDLSNRANFTVRNVGDTPINGSVSPIKVEFTFDLPPGTTITPGGLDCKSPVGPCTASEDTSTLEPLGTKVYGIGFNAGSSGTGEVTARISGGEAGGLPVAPATVTQPITVSATPAPFGLQASSVLAEFVDADDGPETQAGAHPYDLTVDFNYATAVHLTPESGVAGILEPAETPKDLAVLLPPGVAGNELALGQCPSQAYLIKQCNGGDEVGAISIQSAGGVIFPNPFAIFNLKPDNGHTNEIGFTVNRNNLIRMPTSVRVGSDYGLTNLSPNIPSLNGPLLKAEAQIWGVPADPSHDGQRVGTPGHEPGSPAEQGALAAGKFVGHESPLPPVPFLTMPSECGKPLVFRLATDSYNHPGRVNSAGGPDLSDPNWKVVTVTDPSLTGCEKLQAFAPHVTVAPDTTFADTPAGTTVEVSVPQGEGLTSPSTLATSTLQDTKVTLPVGLVVNPGQANGLAACQPGEDGLTTSAEAAEGKENTGLPSCPGASKVGTVEIETPLLPDKLEGTVYVLQSNPPDLQLLVAASADGVNVKLLGHVDLDPVTGQVTSTFSGTPQLPFTHFRLAFSGGAQAALTTPPSCGVYSSTSDFTPWSSPFTADFLSADGFALTSGPSGSPCASPLPFSPSLIAGSTTDQAGGFTDFSLLLERGDGQQRIAGLQFKTPEGLLGMISKVPLCPESEAAAGTCSAASQIGHTVVGAGAGPAPFYVPEAGQPPAPIYLTGPYKGAPFGLSIVVPVIAGPFNLGTVVVRAAISVDPLTSRLTISTDALPQILAGIPTDLRQINAVIDREGFMFNPTSCAPQEFSGTAQSAEGTTAAISSHYQVGSCQSLKFKPDFKISTSGKTSRLNGASLDARVLYPTGPLAANQASSQSNIASVKVDLPKQLPSRLTTLQKACTVAQFEANPAGCPVASRIGVVKALTPVLPVALTGPVYFVSHGGEAFPSLIAVLQGYGVRVDLVASTLISKAGITSSTFRQVPDVPISSFEIYLPEGKYSALAANGNLCKSKLAMPTSFTAQNGAVIKQSTPIAVTGCAKAKAAAKKKRAGRARKSSHGGGRKS